jgi:hypothetical protein
MILIQHVCQFSMDPQMPLHCYPLKWIGTRTRLYTYTFQIHYAPKILLVLLLGSDLKQGEEMLSKDFSSRQSNVKLETNRRLRKKGKKE